MTSSVNTSSLTGTSRDARSHIQLTFCLSIETNATRPKDATQTSTAEFKFKISTVLQTEKFLTNTVV